MLYKASAPGTLMLMGEYAVLHGKQALVCAINKRINVDLSLRTDNKIYIDAGILGTHATSLDELQIIAPFQFVMAVFQEFHAFMSVGCNVTITADFSDKIGFGSSAAVTVALCKALAEALQRKLSSLDLIALARSIIQKVQGIGSGADVAASVLGGVVHYRMNPLSAKSLIFDHPLTIVFSGFKTKTADAVSQMKDKYSAYPKLYSQIFQAIDFCVTESITCIQNSDWQNLGKLMNIHQGLLDALGVSLPILNSIIDTLRREPLIHGAKISGSGLGDCLVGLGSAGALKFADADILTIPVAISKLGVCCESA